MLGGGRREGGGGRRGEGAVMGEDTSRCWYLY